MPAALQGRKLVFSDRQLHIFDSGDMSTQNFNFAIKLLNVGFFNAQIVWLCACSSVPQLVQLAQYWLYFLC